MDPTRFSAGARATGSEHLGPGGPPRWAQGFFLLCTGASAEDRAHSRPHAVVPSKHASEVKSNASIQHARQDSTRAPFLRRRRRHGLTAMVDAGARAEIPRGLDEVWIPEPTEGHRGQHDCCVHLLSSYATVSRCKPVLGLLIELWEVFVTLPSAGVSGDADRMVRSCAVGMLDSAMDRLSDSQSRESGCVSVSAVPCPFERVGALLVSLFRFVVDTRAWLSVLVCAGGFDPGAQALLDEKMLVLRSALSGFVASLAADMVAWVGSHVALLLRGWVLVEDVPRDTAECVRQQLLRSLGSLHRNVCQFVATFG